MAKSDAPRIAILGAGPIGLEAALYARKLKLSVVVYERGRGGDHIQRWGHVRLFTPFSMNSTPLGRAEVKAENARHTLPGDGDCVTGREYLAAYLEPLAKAEVLRDCLRTETQVLAVGRRGFLKGESVGDAKRGQQPFRLLVRDGKKAERIDEADVVLDCTGTYGKHRWLGDGGIPAAGELAAEAHVAYAVDDILGDRLAAYAGKTVVVIGAGYSAAASVCSLATLGEKNADTWVIWLARGVGSQPIQRFTGDPLKERDRLAVRANTLATRTDDNVEFHPGSVIDAVEYGGPDKGFRVTARRDGKARVWECDRLIANVGYSPDNDLTRELHVQESYASLGPMNLATALAKVPTGDRVNLAPFGAAALRTAEPNFYILGAKSFGRDSHFLMQMGFEQVREVFALIVGKSDLNLYKSAR